RVDVRRRLPDDLVDVPPQNLNVAHGRAGGTAPGRGGGSTDPFLPTIARNLASQNGNCYPRRDEIAPRGPRAATPPRRRPSRSARRKIQALAEADHLHRLPRPNRGLARTDREAVSGNHGAENARALGAGEAGAVAVA